MTKPKTTKKPAKKATPTTTKAPTRASLRSMKVSSGFREFVLDQLSGIGGLRAHAMFGGIGLYSEEAFFGLVAADTLFLKVDDTNRADYETAGSQPFQPYADRPMTMSYYNVPVVVLEDAKVLGEWAVQAVGVARAAKGKAGAKTKRAKAR